MTEIPEGRAVVYCEGAFNTPNGKTAHGLVRYTRRYHVEAVIDSRYAGNDAGEILDGRPRGIPVLRDLQAVLESKSPSHFVIGLAPDGGRLSDQARNAVIQAIEAGLHIDSGLHDFLSDDPEISALAGRHQVRIRDVRMTPPRTELHFFTGRIEQVTAQKIAILGTDSAIGKRTTAWILHDALIAAGYSCQLVGTGQTAWMQGVKYGIILDSMINDFLSGELEHAVWSAWNENHPRTILIEGQGSLMNPAYPGGYEILAAARPDLVVMQHAPARTDYDGFPGYAIHPLRHQIEAVEVVSGKQVVMITINHENLSRDAVEQACADIEKELGIPAVDPLWHDPQRMVDVLSPYLSPKP